MAMTDSGDDDGATDALWRARAIERSTRGARQRAAKRVQRFLDAARAVISDKGSIAFTVQEVVDRSGQSLRSFYQYFDGKHELLLALFEEEIREAVERIRAATAQGDPLDQLGQAVRVLYKLCTPGRTSVQPLFFEFAQRLLISHPDEVTRAYTPMFEQFAGMVEAAAEAGLLRPGKPRRQAAIVMQAASTTAGRSAGTAHPITADEMWEFCLHAVAPDEVVAARTKRAARSKSA